MMKGHYDYFRDARAAAAFLATDKTRFSSRSIFCKRRTRYWICDTVSSYIEWIACSVRRSSRVKSDPGRSSTDVSNPWTTNSPNVSMGPSSSSSEESSRSFPSSPSFFASSRGLLGAERDGPAIGPVEKTPTDSVRATKEPVSALGNKYHKSRGLTTLLHRLRGRARFDRVRRPSAPDLSLERKPVEVTPLAVVVAEIALPLRLLLDVYAGVVLRGAVVALKASS